MNWKCNAFLKTLFNALALAPLPTSICIVCAEKINNFFAFYLRMLWVIWIRSTQLFFTNCDQKILRAVKCISAVVSCQDSFLLYLHFYDLFQIVYFCLKGNNQIIFVILQQSIQIKTSHYNASISPTKVSIC